MFSRRDFLRTSTLVALAPTVPGFLARTARAAEPARDGRILVVLQLDGGNDGINMVVPFADEGYIKHRTALRLPVDRLHKITKEVGLHPAMADAAKLLESGRLAVVQGVGYPNPSRSHDRSMAIWHSADVKLPRDGGYAEGKAALGWIGGALDEDRKPADGSAGAVFVGAGALPPALRGRRSAASAITRPEDSVLTLKGVNQEAGPADDLAAFVRRTTLDAYATSDRMSAVLRAEDKGASYPATSLAGRMRIIARLIKGGCGTRIYYTSQGGYDTHSIQLEQHANLLGELSGGLKALLDDLAAAKLSDRVLVLCFSEFGRRVKENGSAGTDHGTSEPVLLAGPSVKAGLVGEAPRLLDLEDGDLKTIVDFRQIYASVLEDWLGIPSKPALGGEYNKPALFNQLAARHSAHGARGTKCGTNRRGIRTE
jgi:uncharacterized protein (DUF1501 family)